MPEFGSFGAALPGGTPAVEAALQRRRFGDRGSLLSQVSGGAPTATAATGATAQVPRTGSAMPRGAQQVPRTPRPPSPPPAESEIIVKALSQRLAALSKMEAPPREFGAPRPQSPQL